MFTKRFTKVFALVFICVLGTVFSVRAAWGNGGPEAPYQGSYTYWTTSGPGIVSYAYNMKWTQAAINDMKWDGNTEVLDQTADCTQDSPGGDRLHTQSSSTNIPNTGINGYNDCGVYQWFEESELKINPYSLNTTTTYWQTVNWQCVYGGASGDLNISFEPAPWAHEWLDKESYSCGYSLMSSGNTAHLTDDFSPSIKPEVLREVDNGTFSYQVIRTSNGLLRVYSDVDFLDAEIFEVYRAENKRLLNEALSGKPVGVTTLVVITFASPITTEEAEILTQNAKMDVISYGIFGHMENEVVSTYVFPPSRTIEVVSQEEQSQVNGGEITYDGIMTITGFVDNVGLQVLDSHQDVALLDLTASRIQPEISDLEGAVDLQQFSIPNPAWHIYADEIE